jgi:hypothetical protein
MVKLQSFTQPGEVLFNLIALIHLVALLFYFALLSQMPEALGDWEVWMMVAGPLAFWIAVVVIFIRLRRAGYRPRFRFRGRLSITGSRDCYRAYTERFGRDAFIWTLAIAPVWSFLWFALPVILN